MKNFLKSCLYENLSFLASHLNDNLAWYKILSWKQFSLKIIRDATHQPVVSESGISRSLSRRMAVTRILSDGSVY